MTLASSAVSAVAQIKSGKTAEAIGEEQNRMARIRAKQAMDEGAEQASRANVDTHERLAAIRARMAGGGTTIGGSALDVLSEAARRLETRTQDAFRIAAIDSRNEAYKGSIAQWEGQQAKTAGQMRGFGTLLEGVGSYAQSKTKYKTTS